ncbi:Uma2 family endonuclease, partial [Candidatus Poribacteria bacterium]|nr:Uma2 family endonuclease [Candidatus Poribacteria bacterium]
LWEEGKGPDFVLEVASESTCDYDLGEKKDLYASILGVQEYYLYDPDKRYLPSPLLGFRLVEGVYVPIQDVEGRLPSDTLGLELGEEGGRLRLYNPLTKEWVLKPAEQAKAQAQQAEAEAQRSRAKARQAQDKARRARAQVRQAKAKAQQAESKAQHEALARQQAQAELARLRAELERLRTSSTHP